MLQTVKAFAKQHELFNKSDQLALAISGGRDSVAMAHILNLWKVPFILVHCNFGLRGEASDKDEEFVLTLAAKLSYCQGCFTKSFKNHFKESAANVQEKARTLRYAYFDTLYERGYFTKLITAHHKDDSIETFFINLYRSSGIKGLTGIDAKRNYIIRPFLSVSRKEIDQFIQQNNIDYREDESNAESKYLRNKLRNRVLPSIVSLLPDFRERLEKSLSILNEEEFLLRTLLTKHIEKVVTETKNGDVLIAKSELISFPQSTALLYQILNSYGFNHSQCEQISASLSNNGALFKTEDYQLVVEDKRLFLTSNKRLIDDCLTINNVGEFVLNDKKISISLTESPQLSTHTNQECVCLSSTDFPLKLRLWQNGDRMNPLGMKGTKLVSDILTDLKVNRLEKQSTLVLLSANEQIIWLVGYRISEKFKLKQRCKPYMLRFEAV